MYNFSKDKEEVINKANKPTRDILNKGSDAIKGNGRNDICKSTSAINSTGRSDFSAKAQKLDTVALKKYSI